MIILPDLPYDEGALAPVISPLTLQTHHGRHHRKYIEQTNALLDRSDGGTPTLEDVVDVAWRRSQRKLFNNAAQALNHGFYWACMAPEGSAETVGGLGPVARASFADPAELKADFLQEGAGHFGSGWVWLVSQRGRLSVMATHDADTPFRMGGVTPLVVCDVWEHAYYLDHRNDRSAYLTAWWDRLVDWTFVERQYEASLGRGEPWRYPVAAAPGAARGVASAAQAGVQS